MTDKSKLLEQMRIRKHLTTVFPGGPPKQTWRCILLCQGWMEVSPDNWFKSSSPI